MSTPEGEGALAGQTAILGNNRALVVNPPADPRGLSGSGDGTARVEPRIASLVFGEVGRILV